MPQPLHAWWGVCVQGMHPLAARGLDPSCAPFDDCHASLLRTLTALLPPFQPPGGGDGDGAAAWNAAAGGPGSAHLLHNPGWPGHPVPLCQPRGPRLLPAPGAAHAGGGPAATGPRPPCLQVRMPRSRVAAEPGAAAGSQACSLPQPGPLRPVSRERGAPSRPVHGVYRASSPAPDRPLSRSAYFPVKSVVDGDICEQFAQLPIDKQRQVGGMRGMWGRQGPDQGRECEWQGRMDWPVPLAAGTLQAPGVVSGFAQAHHPALPSDRERAGSQPRGSAQEAGGCAKPHNLTHAPVCWSPYL